MIFIYLSSVILYAMVLYCAFDEAHDLMRRNNWGDLVDLLQENEMALFIISMIPIIRLSFLYGFLYCVLHENKEK